MYGKLFFVLCAVALAIADSAPQLSGNEIQNSAPQQSEQEVAIQLKDPAYAPSYGYEEYVVPAEGPEAIGHVVPGPLSLITDLVHFKTASVFSLLGKAAHFALAGAAAVAFSFLITLGFCTFTPFCTVSLGQYGRIQEEVRSFVTPQRLASATEFVKNAIEKYQKMQQ